MAATPFDPALPSTSFQFDIYNDAQAAALGHLPLLPTGPCNYTDQTLPRCGCRRFWSKPASSRGGSQDGEVCSCTHHACYHDYTQPGQGPAPVHPAIAASVNVVAGQENERPRTNREPLSPVQDLDLPSSFHLPSNLGSSLEFDMLNFQAPVAVNLVDVQDAPPAEDTALGHESPMPDTLSWGGYVPSQQGLVSTSALPPIPYQCLMPSHPPSTASSSQARYLRPFAGKGLHTLRDASALDDGAPQVAAQDDLVSMRHAATPMAPPQKPGEGQSSMVTTSSSRDAIQDLSNTVQNHEQRIDRLENTSFSVAGHEDCNEKHDHTDLRVTELESRVDDFEKLLSHDHGSVASSRLLGRRDVADDATASVVSVSTNATARASSRSDYHTQIQMLQAKVDRLQAASLPTYNNPWLLEVVFLPFPLKGVWVEAHDFAATQRQSGAPGTHGDEWTQMPNTVSRSTPDPQSPHLGEWVGAARASRWLLPRAFAPDKAIDQRLKSRGFVKEVQVRGSDARSIQLAIDHAFGDVLRVSAGGRARAGPEAHSALDGFLGLRQAWVPLRKIHKDSRLRFLAPAEMATPTLWDYTLLVSSVVMKATGMHRLYVTQPEAYLQDHPLGRHAFEAGWTWQKVRELSRVYPDSQSSSNGDVPEADARETYWAWNDRLDEAPGSSSHSTLSLHTAPQQLRQSRRSSTSPSQQFYTGAESPILSNSPGVARLPSPVLPQDSRAPRPPHIRTTSLPPIAPAMPSPSQSRRRIASYTSANLNSPFERRSSPLVSHSRASPRPQAAAANTLARRRLGTRSPSLIPRNTPRWSRASMSRSPSLVPLGPPGFGFAEDPDRAERRTTPLFYATPYSNAPHEPPAGQFARAESRGPVRYASHGLEDENMGGGDDEDDDDYYDDRGSSTDPDSAMNDALEGGGPDFGYRRLGDGDGDGDDVDIDIDVYEDEGEDDLDGVDTEGDGDASLTPPRSQGQGQGQGHAQMRPEDVPWLGIEDHMSDGENVDPTTSQSQEIAIYEDESPASDRASDSLEEDHESGGGGDDDVQLLDRQHDADADDASDLSSLPSEYPSTQNAWHAPSGTVATIAPAGGNTDGLATDDAETMEFQIHEDGEGRLPRGPKTEGPSAGPFGMRWG